MVTVLNFQKQIRTVPGLFVVVRDLVVVFVVRDLVVVIFFVGVDGLRVDEVLAVVVAGLHGA